MTATRSPKHGPALPHTLQGDGAHGGEGGFVEAHLSGHRYGERAGDVHDLSMVGVFAASTGHAVSGLEAPGQLARGRDHAGAAVADGALLLQARLDGAVGLEQSVAPYLLDHLGNLIGPAAGLAHEALLAEVDFGPFGAGADERPGVAGQDAVGAQRGRRDVEHLDAAVLDRLGHLLHGLSSSRRVVRFGVFG